MKKIYSLLLVFAMLLSLCACGGSNEKFEEKNEASKPEETNVSSSAMPELNSLNTLTIEGAKYALPAPTQMFVNNGWYDRYDNLNQEIKAEKGGYYSLGLSKGEKEQKIAQVGFYNHTTSDSTLAQSYIFQLKLVGFSNDSSELKCSFTLPYGITENSTYEDILEIFGVPENSYTDSQDYVVSDDYETAKKNNSIEKYGFTVTCTPKDKNNYPYNYRFTFNADKTIRYVDIESVNYMSSAIYNAFHSSN